MALKLNDLSKNENQKKKSLLDMILELKDKRLRDELIQEKTRTLRPWESLQHIESVIDTHYESLKRPSVKESFHRDCDDFLSHDERMLRRIKKRARELFGDLEL